MGLLVVVLAGCSDPEPAAEVPFAGAGGSTDHATAGSAGAFAADDAGTETSAVQVRAADAATQTEQTETTGEGADAGGDGNNDDRANCRTAIEAASGEPSFLFVPCDPSVFAYNGTTIAQCGAFDAASYADFEAGLLQPPGWTLRNEHLVRAAEADWQEEYRGDEAGLISIATDFYDSPEIARTAAEMHAARNAEAWGPSHEDCQAPDCLWPTEQYAFGDGQAILMLGWFDVPPAAASSAPVETSGHKQMRLWAVHQNIVFKLDGYAHKTSRHEAPRQQVLCEIDAILRSLQLSP